MKRKTGLRQPAVRRIPVARPDGLPDFRGHPPIVELDRRLCRHDRAVDPEAAAGDVAAYRGMWDSEGADDAEESL